MILLFHVPENSFRKYSFKYSLGSETLNLLRPSNLPFWISSDNKKTLHLILSYMLPNNQMSQKLNIKSSGNAIKNASDFCNNLKIAIVDDHEMFRSGIKLILSEKTNWDIVIEAEDGRDFLQQLKVLVPDIVLMDISMPNMNGYDTTIEALRIHPDLKVIIITMLNEEEYYYKLVKAGVRGFILKNSGTNELFHAIEEVSNGNNYFAQDLLKKLLLTINTREVDKKLKLKEKEKKVLHLVSNGFTTKEISEKLFLSEKSIEKYRTSLLQKTNTRNSAHLVMYAIVNKLIEF